MQLEIERDEIIETAEDRISNKLIKKYNIFFDKEKVHNLFYNFEISYSDINQYEIYFLPIHKKIINFSYIIKIISMRAGMK